MTLTDKDFKKFEDLIDQKIDENAETTLATKDDIKHLPNKEEFYDREDKLMFELKAIREEIGVLSNLQEKTFHIFPQIF